MRTRFKYLIVASAVLTIAVVTVIMNIIRSGERSYLSATDSLRVKIFFTNPIISCRDGQYYVHCADSLSKDPQDSGIFLHLFDSIYDKDDLLIQIDGSDSLFYFRKPYSQKPMIMGLRYDFDNEPSIYEPVMFPYDISNKSCINSILRDLFDKDKPFYPKWYNFKAYLMLKVDEWMSRCYTDCLPQSFSLHFITGGDASLVTTLDGQEYYTSEFGTEVLKLERKNPRRDNLPVFGKFCDKTDLYQDTAITDENYYQVYEKHPYLKYRYVCTLTER